MKRPKRQCLLSRRQGKAEAVGSHGATEPKRSRAVVFEVDTMGYEWSIHGGFSIFFSEIWIWMNLRKNWKTPWDLEGFSEVEEFEGFGMKFHSRDGSAHRGCPLQNLGEIWEVSQRKLGKFQKTYWWNTTLYGYEPWDYHGLSKSSMGIPVLQTQTELVQNHVLAVSKSGTPLPV